MRRGDALLSACEWDVSDGAKPGGSAQASPLGTTWMACRRPEIAVHSGYRAADTRRPVPRSTADRYDWPEPARSAPGRSPRRSLCTAWPAPGRAGRCSGPCLSCVSLTSVCSRSRATAGRLSAQVTHGRGRWWTVVRSPRKRAMWRSSGWRARPWCLAPRAWAWRVAVVVQHPCGLITFAAPRRLRRP